MVALSRSALIRRLLIAVPASRLVAPPLPAHALIGEVIGEGFVQGDDKSWDFTLPSKKWKIDETKSPRAEHPQRLFHVTGARDGGASLDLIVQPSGKRSASEIGKVDAVASQLAPSYGEVISSEVVPGVVRGSKYYVMKYARSDGGSTLLKLDAKQGRTYSLAVSLPKKPSADLQAEADELIASFKCFPVNAFCIAQSNGGSTPASGSCY